MKVYNQVKDNVEYLVKTVLDANNEAYPLPVGVDIANNVLAWVNTNLLRQAPVFDLVFVSEGWDEDEYVSGFDAAISNISERLDYMSSSGGSFTDILVTDTVDSVVKRTLKSHNASYDVAANEISKMVLGYVIGYIAFYKNSDILNGSESFNAGVVKASDNILNICRAYIY